MAVTGKALLDLGLSQLEQQTSDGFVDEVLGLAWVNMALAELHDILVGTFEDYFLDRHIFRSADGAEQPLPEDFYKLIKVITADGYPLRKLSKEDLQRDSRPYTTRTGSDVPQYRILGNRIFFDPAPSQDVTLWYVPQFLPLQDLRALVHISVPAPWTSYVAMDLAARALAKEESDFSFYELRKAQMKQRIEELAEQRDAGEPEAIIDVYPDYDPLLEV